MAVDLSISDLLLLPDHSQRKDPRTCPLPRPFPTCGRALGSRRQGSHLCGGQAGLAAVLGVVTHLHVIGLFLGDLLTHHGYLALPGVAPKDGGKKSDPASPSCLTSASTASRTRAHTLAHTAAVASTSSCNHGGSCRAIEALGLGLGFYVRKGPLS